MTEEQTPRPERTRQLIDRCTLCGSEDIETSNVGIERPPCEKHPIGEADLHCTDCWMEMCDACYNMPHGYYHTDAKGDMPASERLAWAGAAHMFNGLVKEIRNLKESIEGVSVALEAPIELKKIDP